MAKLLLHAVLHFCNSLFVLNANSSFKKLFLVCVLGPQFVFFFLKHLRESLFDQLFVVAEFLVSLLVRVCKSARRTNHNVRSIVGRFSFFRQRWRFRPIVKRMRFFVFFAATAPANMSISMHCVFAWKHTSRWSSTPFPLRDARSKPFGPQWRFRLLPIVSRWRSLLLIESSFVFEATFARVIVLNHIRVGRSITTIQVPLRHKLGRLIHNRRVKTDRGSKRLLQLVRLILLQGGLGESLAESHREIGSTADLSYPFWIEVGHQLGRSFGWLFSRADLTHVVFAPRVDESVSGESNPKTGSNWHRLNFFLYFLYSMGSQKFAENARTPQKETFGFFRDWGAKAARGNETHRNVRNLLDELHADGLISRRVPNLASGVVSASINEAWKRKHKGVVVAARNLFAAIWKVWHLKWHGNI